MSHGKRTEQKQHKGLRTPTHNNLRSGVRASPRKKCRGEERNDTNKLETLQLFEPIISARSVVVLLGKIIWIYIPGLERLSKEQSAIGTSLAALNF